MVLEVSVWLLELFVFSGCVGVGVQISLTQIESRFHF